MMKRRVFLISYFLLQQSVKFWFATGGAGFCLSQSLASKLMPLIGGGKFESVGDKIRLPDDVTMGYAIEVRKWLHDYSLKTTFILVMILIEDLSFLAAFTWCTFDHNIRIPFSYGASSMDHG